MRKLSTIILVISLSAASLFAFANPLLVLYEAIPILWRAAPIATALVRYGIRKPDDIALIAATEYSVIAHAGVIMGIYFADPDDVTAMGSGSVRSNLNIQIVPNTERQIPSGWEDDPNSFDPRPQDHVDAVPNLFPAIPAEYTTDHLIEDGGGTYRIGTEIVTYSTLVLDSCTEKTYHIPDGGTVVRCSLTGSHAVQTPIENTDPVEYAETTQYEYTALYRVAIPADSVPNYICPEGYSQDEYGSCYLPENVIINKPAEVVCEVVLTTLGVWDSDIRNPACKFFQEQVNLLVDSANNRVTAANGKETVSVKKLPDSSLQITHATPDNVRIIDTEPYDSSLGGYPIKSVSDTSGDNDIYYDPGDSDSGTTGGDSTSGDSGTGDTTGTSGSGLGCGTEGLPDCGVMVNDDGFNDLATDIGGINQSIDDHDESIFEALAGITHNNDHGITFNWLPTIPRVQCQAIEFGDGKHMITIDWCSHLEVIRLTMAWLLYIFAGWQTIEILTSRTARGGN